MNITSKIALGLSIIAGCTIVAVPNFYNSKINDYITNSQKLAETKGIVSEVKSINDTFFNIEREYNLTLSDSSYIINSIGLSFDSKEFEDIKKLLNDTEFSLSVNLPKYPSMQKDAISISLKELSPDVQMVLNTEKLGRELIDFIESKGLLLTLSLDNFILKNAKLKDINLNLKDKDKRLNQKVKNFVVNFDSLKQFNVNIDKLSTVIGDKKFFAEMKVNSIKYKIDKKDDYNLDENAHIKNISFSFLEDSYRKNSANVNIKDIKTSSNIFSKNDLLGAVSDLGIKKISIKNKKDNFEFIDLHTKLSIGDLNKELIENLVDSMDKGSFMDEEKLAQGVQDIVHEGFLFDIDKLEVGKTKINLSNEQFELEKISFDTQLKVNSNNINLNAEPSMFWLNSLSSKANLEMTKKDIISIMTKLKVPNHFLGFVKIEKEKAFINAEFKNNELLVNNKKVL